MDWWLAVKWVLANTVAATIAILGLLPAFVVLQIPGTFAVRIAGENIGKLIFYSLLGAVAGIPIGLMQAYVLKKFISQVGWWILVSIVGWATGTGLWVVFFPSQTSVSGHAAILGALIGISVGFAQTVVLRRHIHHAQWWTLANTLGWSVGLLVGYIVCDNVPRMSAVIGNIATSGVTSNIVLGATSGVIAGTITGLVLTKLLQQPIQYRTAYAHREQPTVATE